MTYNLSSQWKKVNEKNYTLESCDLSIAFNFNTELERKYLFSVDSFSGKKFYMEYNISKNNCRIFSQHPCYETMEYWKEIISASQGLPREGVMCLEVLLMRLEHQLRA